MRDPFIDHEDSPATAVLFADASDSAAQEQVAAGRSARTRRVKFFLGDQTVIRRLIGFPGVEKETQWKNTGKRNV